MLSIREAVSGLAYRALLGMANLVEPKREGFLLNINWAGRDRAASVLWVGREPEGTTVITIRVF